MASRWILGGGVLLIASITFLYLRQDINVDVFLSTILIVLGWLVLILLGTNEIRNTHENALTAQKQLLRQQFQIELYKQLVHEIDEVHDPLNDLIVFLSGFPGFDWRFRHEMDPTRPTIPGRGVEVQERFQRSLDGTLRNLAKLISHIENFSVVYGSLATMAKDLAKASDKLRDLGYQSLGQVLGELRSDSYQSNPDFLKGAEQHISPVSDAAMDLTGYLHDIRQESQNYFLSHLFEHTAPKRKPLDPNITVLEPNQSTDKNADTELTK